MPVVRQPETSPTSPARRPVYREVPPIRHADSPARAKSAAADRPDDREVPRFSEPYVRDRLRHFADY